MKEIERYLEILKGAGLNPEQVADVLKSTVHISIDNHVPFPLD